MTTIPAITKLAARRAFIRTTAQGYAASLTLGLLTSIVMLLIDRDEWLTVLVTVILAVLSPPLAGVVAWFQWLAKGLPEDYEPIAQIERGVTLRRDL